MIFQQQVLQEGNGLLLRDLVASAASKFRSNQLG
jgi:hypothetical protein